MTAEPGAGVRDAIGRLYADTGHLVLRRCLQVLRSREEALDVVQWTFVRALDTRFEVRSRRQALAWLYQTAVRRCLWVMRNDRHRSQIVTRHRPELDGSRAILDVEGDTIRRDLLVRALDGMTDEQGAMVLMSTVWGYGLDRVAELMGTSVRTVGRARSEFQARFEQIAGPAEPSAHRPTG